MARIVKRPRPARYGRGAHAHRQANGKPGTPCVDCVNSIPGYRGQVTVRHPPTPLVALGVPSPAKPRHRDREREPAWKV